MNIKMQIKNKVLTLTFPSKAQDLIVSRMKEMSFETTNNKVFQRAQFLTQNEYDYIIAMCKSNGLGMPYVPSTSKGFILDTHVPDSMGQEMHLAARKIKKNIGGSFINYLCDRLDYSEDELLDSLACEQVDAVSMAIYNIEKKNGIIIGDQTGIGKGRTAAAIIRYGVKQGKTPIFLSEKPNLFSDLYRDMVDIKSEHLKPFIVNARNTATNIKDKDNEIIYRAPFKAEQLKILKNQALPSEYDYVCATYSQFQQAKEVVKRGFLHHIAKDNVIVMDEAHNASGASQTGMFMMGVIRESKGVCFLSATFAKRPDNMPIYALKTSMREANLTSEGLVKAITGGGVPLQEILASQLVAEGQMLRRERTFDGIEVNYIELKKKKEEHQIIADTITAIIRKIIGFQDNWVDDEVKALDKMAAREGKEVTSRQGTKRAGCDNAPAFSKVFNTINQLLFSINAEDVADHVIKLHKEGKKPIVAFASTMGSFLEGLGDVGDIVNADFASVLYKGLAGTLRYTVRGVNGKSTKKSFSIQEFSPEAQAEYREIQAMIRKCSTGIYISPIDLIKQKLTEAGISVGEVTGRSVAVQYGDWEMSSVKEDPLPLTLEDIPSIVKKVMPFIQQQAILGSVEHYRTLEELEKQIKSVPKINKTDGKKEYEKTQKTSSRVKWEDYAKPKLHYFYGGSDWYITEWDGKDTFYGFAILNGDTQNAEWGYVSLSEILSLEIVELDFYFSSDKPLSHHLKHKGFGNTATKTKKKKRVTSAQIVRRPKENVVDMFRKYNENEIDVLLINQSGSTGASAHAVTTDNVPLDEVKQRVMVILQAELDISTEIQKRGRINRTGQVMLPIYDYIISTIPAQKRLLMMLKKKLKSLDANTTSNQENSGSQLESDDFLNKYGDKVIYEYLLERTDLAAALSDPLNLVGKGDMMIDGAASKVSGRVAVLPVKDQERFYNDVMIRYKNYVKYLRENDQYDLEVETLDLKAKTLEKEVLIGGKGGRSAFGSDTFIEKCECNILKKPFTFKELEKELKSSEKLKDGPAWSREFIEYNNKRLDNELNEIEERFDEQLANITHEKAFDKAPDKSDYVKTRQAEIEENRKDTETRAITKSKNRQEYLCRYFEFFKTGNSYNFPAVGVESERVASVFLGYSIQENQTNPFAPSAVNLRFAIADSRRMLSLTCAGDAAQMLNTTISLSLRLYQDYVRDWQTHIQKYDKSRGIRFIVTGNLLQASSTYSNGKLVSYTTKSGKAHKGILMPESWSPSSDKNSRAASHIVTPIANVVNYIMGTSVGTTLSTTNDISISRHSLDDFMMVMPKKKTHIPLYTDKDIVKQLRNNKDGFEMVSGVMRALISADKMPKLIKLMGDRYSISLEVPRTVYEKIFGNKKKSSKDDFDTTTNEAMEMFKEDKAKFPDRLKAQKNKQKKKSKAKPKTPNNKEKERKKKKMQLRARAILIMQNNPE